MVFFLWYNKDSKPREVIYYQYFSIKDTGNVFYQTIPNRLH